MLNKSVLIGRIGQTESGVIPNTQTTVCNFSIATTESYKDKQSGDWQEKTEWHNLVAFKACADHISQKLIKGDLVYVEGKLRTRKWQDKDGKDRYTTEIVVNDFPKKLPRYFTQNGNGQASASAPAQPQSQAMPQAAGGENFSGFDDIDFPD